MWQISDMWRILDFLLYFFTQWPKWRKMEYANWELQIYILHYYVYIYLLTWTLCMLHEPFEKSGIDGH